MSEAASDLEHALRLIERYDRPGPRYTSYPPATEWDASFGAEDYEAALEGLAELPLALYVHVPFCERLCTYCACNRVITRDHGVAGPYLDGLEREAELVARAIGRPGNAVQLAVGGGTPTFLSERELERLSQIVDERFPARSGAERSIEVDPRVTRREQLEVLAANGFNRISLGVQDLSPRVQRAIHREQSLAQTEAVASAARALGFRSVSFDLIYGLPFQTLASFDETLDAVLELRPDRIALYSYAHVTWVSKQQRGFEKQDLPPADRKVAIFLRAAERLTAAGYRHVGLDHFALPTDELCVAAESGELRRNFMGYTTGSATELIAFGASGISELSCAYAQSEREPGLWADRVAKGELATLRGWWMTSDDVRRKWLLQRLMCDGEIDPARYAESFGEALASRVPDLEPQLEAFVADGLLSRCGDVHRVTRLGRLFLRPIAMAFDAYRTDPVAGEPRFSRTV